MSFSLGKHSPLAVPDGSLPVLDADDQNQTKCESSSSTRDSNETTRDSSETTSNEPLLVLSTRSDSVISAGDSEEPKLDVTISTAGISNDPLSTAMEIVRLG